MLDLVQGFLAVGPQHQEGTPLPGQVAHVHEGAHAGLPQVAQGLGKRALRADVGHAGTLLVGGHVLAEGLGHRNSAVAAQR